MRPLLPVFAVLALAMLACSLQGSHTAATAGTGAPNTPAQISPQPTQTTQPVPTGAPNCTVATGTQSGHLTVRSCASVKCLALDYLSEGDSFEPARSDGSWLYIDSLKGWVNSNFTSCERK